MDLFSRLKQGLSKTRSRILTSIEEGKEGVSPEFYEELEDALIQADIGVELTLELLDLLRDEVAREEVRSAGQAYERLKEIISRGLSVAKMPDEFPPKPWVMVVVGVNGVGKTTTIGKLAHELHAQGKSVLLGAADTFRAGAIEQLRIWAERTDSAFVAQQAGADAASVSYDALEAARNRNLDVVLLDTAGRLHSKANLMEELRKVVRVIKRHTPHAPNEMLLVIDATTGQNALKQAETFHEALGLTGLIITKLDGTAKGGIALSLAKKLKIPIKKVGVGEGLEDLQDFDPRAYVDAMFGGLETH
jgi:fused signal recognition particle receptor